MKNYIFKIYLHILIFIDNKRNIKADSIFWYSKKQEKIVEELKQYNIHEFQTKGKCTFKGLKYTEMKSLKSKNIFSNFDDAEFVGIGTIEDVIWPTFL